VRRIAVWPLSAPAARSATPRPHLLDDPVVWEALKRVICEFAICWIRAF
jgi:hypothetical protein